MVATAAQLDQMKKMTEDLVETYCTHVTAISDLITESYEMMERYKEDREKIRKELRELLAAKNSLRRKDFDILIDDAMEPQFVREKEVKEILHRFLAAQKVLSVNLKESLQLNDLGMVRDLKSEIEQEIDQAKQVVVFFHLQQSSLLQRFKSLLKKGSRLTVTEFKEVMGQIRKEFAIAKVHTATAGSAGLDVNGT